MNFSFIKPFANGLFLLEHFFILWYLLFILLVAVVLTFSFFWQALNKFHFSQKSFLFLWMRVSGSRYLKSLLVVSLKLLYYYWVRIVVLTISGRWTDFFKACYYKIKETNLWKWLINFFSASVFIKVNNFHKEKEMLYLNWRHIVGNQTVALNTGRVTRSVDRRWMNGWVVCLRLWSG